MHASADPVSAARDRAFERLYRRYVKDVYRYTLAVLRNPADAEDITQTTFLNAYRAIKRGEEPIKPQNWLIKIAHNACRTRYLHSSRRPTEIPLEDNLRELAVPTEEIPSVRAVLDALAELPFNQRAALVMRELEGRSYSEISQALDVTVPAVETLIFRARSSLRVRRSSLKTLAALPLPGSLSSFSGGSAAVGGGALLGSGVALKAALAVGIGLAAGGVGTAVHATVLAPAPQATADLGVRILPAPRGPSGARTAGLNAASQGQRATGSAAWQRTRRGKADLGPGVSPGAAGDGPMSSGDGHSPAAPAAADGAKAQPAAVTPQASPATVEETVGKVVAAAPTEQVPKVAVPPVPPLPAVPPVPPIPPVPTLPPPPLPPAPLPPPPLPPPPLPPPPRLP